MPATTDNQAFHPKSVYNRQYSTEGQTQTVSSGAYKLFESGAIIETAPVFCGYLARFEV